MSDFEKVFTVKKEITKDQFLREALIALSKDDRTPSNIMDAEFGKVTEFSREVIFVSADVEVSYSGSVGYDRQEEYTDYEEKYDHGLQRTVRQAVTKTRTVTDWHPHSGNLKTHVGDFEWNGREEDTQLLSLFKGALRSAKDESVVEEGSAVVDGDAYQNAIYGCKFHAEWSVNWPGDHHKDERYNSVANPTSIQCFIAPCYEVSFTYGDKEYKVRGMAFGDVNEVHEVPEAESADSVETIETRGQEKVEAKTKAPKTIKKVFIALAVISGIVGVASFQLLPVLGIVGAIGLVIFIILAVVFSKKIKAIEKEVNQATDQEVKELRNQKVLKLEAALNRYGLEEMSSAEKADIDKNDDFE